MHTFRDVPIKDKLRVVILITSAVVLVIASSIFVINEIIVFRRNMVTDLLTLAELIGINSQAMLSFENRKEAEENLSALKAKSNIISAHLFDAYGEPFASYDREHVPRQQGASLRKYYFDITQMPQEEIKDSYFFKDNHLDVFKKIIIANEHIGTLHIQSDLTYLKERLFWVGILMVMVMLASLLLAFVLASKFQTLITTPIYALLSTMKEVSTQKNYSIRTKKLSNDELGTLINGFNEMLTQIELRDKELSHYRDNLEEKVKQRTLELAEARDQALAANKAKSIFLANMSHEIRTPMNAVLGYAQILQRDSTLTKEQKETLQIIQNSGNHLLGLINDILDISKIEAGAMEVRPENFYLDELIKGISAMFKIRCEQKQLIWRVEMNVQGKQLVYADQGKLRQILINLLGNAVKFTERGEVVLCISKADEEIYHFDVTDTGQGIPRKSQHKIFEPFQQEKAGFEKGGTGLGLAITKRQVELMQGTIHVVSKVGKGSCFTVQLPLVPGTEEVVTQLRNNQIPRLPPQSHIRALVADDVRENRDILSYTLRDIGVEVCEVKDGQGAIDLIEKEKVDIIFMDIRMPVVDGKEAMRRIRQQYSKEQLPSIAISASTLQHQTKEVLEAGFNDFISKPFQFEEIYDCLAKFLKIEFDYIPSQPMTPTTPETPLDLSQIILPQELYMRLYEAAELNELTELEQLLAKMSQGPYHALAQMLNNFLANYEIDNILHTLQQMSHGDESLPESSPK